MFEGRVRQRHAERGLDELHRVVDTLITIPTQRLLAVAGKNTKMKDAFRLADDVLLGAVRGISDLITGHGLINLDFNDVRAIMNEMGMALMGSGTSKGETRATDAARSAISNPLLEDLSMEGARGVLINFTGGPDMTLHEVEEAAKLIQESSHEYANIIFGAVVDEEMEGEVRVTVIATGLDDGRIGRGRDRHDPAPVDRSSDFGKVTPLRREPAESPREPVTAAEHEPEVRAREPQNQKAPVQEELDGFDSPFEDEFDEPAFLRKRRGDEGNRELPAFLRRSAD
jgi:cell division protein FtsZ